ncbi:erythromycin esterase family protein [Streptomyces sp. NRRL F-5123]|uniref:erythromycin esterase family protein n=1 Tax=Streptomyces sp. NRRL F-5123 TaxID=1463856 RepID=UPI000B26858D|nr:erythromycin esterase family protein [Streptomyces sp. NRRL F-5123]
MTAADPGRTTTETLSPAELDALAAAVASGAPRVAGLGESTRFAHDTSALRDLLFRRLAGEHGFRELAVQDDAAAGARLDAYANGGPGTAASALDGAWRPWRTAETAAALEWIRGFNRAHPDDPVRIFGVKPVQAGPADYDAVLGHVSRTAPGRLTELAAHLEPIRTAHDIDEHVQRARGLHPGRPFAEHARDALALVTDLTADGPADEPADEPEKEAGKEAAARMRLIADFHERSVAGRGNYAGDAAAWAAAIAERQRRTGRRVAYWDGIAHTSAAPVTLGTAPERGPEPTVGSALRERYGAGYVSVAIGFHHGDLGVAEVPAPAPERLDARLSAAAPGSPAHWLDLRAPHERRAWSGPATARVISGVYTPARDAAEHLAVASLPDAFDVLVHLHRVSAVRRLP